jgi:hypothetical protein
MNVLIASSEKGLGNLERGEMAYSTIDGTLNEGDEIKFEGFFSVYIGAYPSSPVNGLNFTFYNE